MITIKDIVTDYLKTNGYDGLYNEDECGCLLDDLAPCWDCTFDCRPGYKKAPSEDSPWYGSDWVVGEKKDSK